MSGSFYRNNGDLAVWLAMGLPVVSYFAHFVFRGSSAEFYWNKIDGEMGLTELATLVALVCSVFLAVASMRLCWRTNQTILMRWLFIFLIGCIYFLGEEASWGQHIFEWETPESWAEKNNQNETNLHNTDGILGSLLDQVPRNALTLGALLLGFCYPLWRKWKAVEFSSSDLWYWLLPTSACIAVGLLAPLASLPRRVANENWPIFDLAYGEIKELMLAQFILLYIWSLFARLRYEQNMLTQNRTT